jgi:hypothetical protein
MKTGLLLFALFVFVVVALLAAANATWKARTGEVVARLESSALAPPGSVFAPAMLEGLPDPVARYLRAVLRDSTGLAWHALVRQEGVFRADSAMREGEGWVFDAEQHFYCRPPGFVWDACMRMAPGVDVFVRDALVGGEGAMLGRVAGIFPVAEAHGTGDIAAAALQRWLAETAWFPTALLPGQSVTWTAIDDSTARATATSGEVRASLDFHFGEDSLVAWVGTDSRARAVGGTTVATPWRGRWNVWRWHEGMLIPTSGEAQWELSSKTFTYWRGSVVDVRYH